MYARAIDYKKLTAIGYRLLLIVMIALSVWTNGSSQQLADGFEAVQVMADLQDPASFGFAPDGRLFYGERITGELVVADWDTVTSMYTSADTFFYKFNVPPSRHRSAGLRGFVFDPNFENNGYLYAYYMQDNPRHNRVVRIQANPVDSNFALPGETLLMDLPFNASSSSGSHNGGDLVFGTDGKLYFTTGDGWNGGDNVQSLSTFTGKVMRINSDGSIPNDNPFYTIANGDYRAIYALGLRNPYSVSNLSPTEQIYINDAVGTNKASVYLLESGANYGHDGYGGIGIGTDIWANMSVSGAKVITGGLWYPMTGYWPTTYHGNYFAAFWGSNANNAPGAITRAISESDMTKSMFYEDVLLPGGLKPVMLKMGPDGNIYYLMTDYETGVGAIYKIQYTGAQIARTPFFSPPGGSYEDSVAVMISSTSALADIYFSIDGSDPDSNSVRYTDPIIIDTSLTAKAIAYEFEKLPSAQAIADYNIGPIPNLPPVANAGPDLIAAVGSEVTLNGSDSHDPDGSPLELQEDWQQISGPPVTIFDSDETVANFTPGDSGLYVFQIVVEDIYGARDSDQVIITILPFIDDYLEELIGRWSFEDGQGSIAEDTSPNSNTGTVSGASWSSERGDSSRYSLQFDDADDRVEIENLDISGSEMSICFWTKISIYDQSDARFISKASGQNDNEHYWMVSTLDNSKLRFRLQTNSGGTSTLISDTGVLPLSEWMFITATYDGSKMKLYKNGVVIDSLNKTGSIATNPMVNASFGNQPLAATGGTRHLTGFLDEVRIYSTALSPEQIDQIYDARMQQLCLSNLLLPEVIQGVDIYRVSDSIQSSMTITNPANIQFWAGESIELVAPFNIEIGATLLGQIAQCNE